jgi:hypothetical protein
MTHGGVARGSAELRIVHPRQVQVHERRGCDLHPIDSTTPAGALLLRSYVWADLVDHVCIRDEAIAISRDVPAPIDQADRADRLPGHALPKLGMATVVFHSLMQASGPPASLDRMAQTLGQCAAVATSDAPLAYLRFEAPEQASPTQTAHARRLVEVRLTTWPGGEERLLATADVNGRNVRWLQ